MKIFNLVLGKPMPDILKNAKTEDDKVKIIGQHNFKNPFVLNGRVNESELIMEITCILNSYSVKEIKHNRNNMLSMFNKLGFKKADKYIAEKNLNNGEKAKLEIMHFSFLNDHILIITQEKKYMDNKYIEFPHNIRVTVYDAKIHDDPLISKILFDSY